MLTYQEIGGTRDETLPAGYRHVTRKLAIGSGTDVFAAAKAALARWQPQVGAGLRVRREAERPAVGVRFSTGIGVGPLRLWVPCEIVYVIDEPTRYGFGFGTLPGHIAVGEEAFLLTMADDGTVWFEVRAFSRPAGLLMRLGGPMARWVQDAVSTRYARAMKP